ncbi:hypothetical protein DFH11DRAFT_1605507 [Phellopilus nigrolimitatus]|nr:hypothetical protein DFH11DRAFT_1605507 [Phellopilus nigrolimitatus]
MHRGLFCFISCLHVLLSCSPVLHPVFYPLHSHVLSFPSHTCNDPPNLPASLPRSSGSACGYLSDCVILRKSARCALYLLAPWGIRSFVVWARQTRVATSYFSDSCGRLGFEKGREQQAIEDLVAFFCLSR